MSWRGLLMAVAVCGLSGCFGLFSLAGKGLSAKTTSIPPTQENWGKLEAAATQLGWTYVRGKPGGSEWLLRVKPSSGGGEVQMDDGANGEGIRYECDGGALESSGKCKEAVNQLFGIAFNVQVK